MFDHQNIEMKIETTKISKLIENITIEMLPEKKKSPALMIHPLY